MFISSKDNEFRILINPNSLSKGYGKLLTKEAFKIAFEDLKFQKISLIVRKSHAVAISLYEKMGFNMAGEVNEIINGEELEFYKMIKLNEGKD